MSIVVAIRKLPTIYPIGFAMAVYDKLDSSVTREAHEEQENGQIRRGIEGGFRVDYHETSRKDNGDSSQDIELSRRTGEFRNNATGQRNTGNNKEQTQEIYIEPEVLQEKQNPLKLVSCQVRHIDLYLSPSSKNADGQGVFSALTVLASPSKGDSR